MSNILADILEHVRHEYIELMAETEAQKPFLSAEQLCHQKLYLNADLLSRVLLEDPTLLAARASDLVSDREEQDNPSVGVIISCNIVMAALESLLATAVENEWLGVDDDGSILVDESEMDPGREYKVTVDYSQSDSVSEHLKRPGESRLTQILRQAEQEYMERLDNEAHDAYQLALEISGGHAIFAPDDLAPLIAENPLLLALRADGMIDDEMFSGDPPAGIIVSSHLTHILMEHLLEIAEERGALAIDGEGQLILPDSDEDKPLIH